MAEQTQTTGAPNASPPAAAQSATNGAAPAAVGVGTQQPAPQGAAQAQEGAAVQPAATLDATAQPPEKTWAALARKEQQTRAYFEREKKQLEVLKAQIEAEKQRYAPVQKAVEEIQGGRALQGLAALGINYEDITRSAIGAPKVDPVQAMQAELAELKKQLSTTSQTYDERLQRAQQEQSLNQLRLDLRAQLAAHATDYPYVADQGHAVDLLMQQMTDHYAQTGEIMDFHSAAQLAEAKERAQLDAVLERALRHNPTRARELLQTAGAGTVPTRQQSATGPARAAGDGAQTLSQTLSSQTTGPTVQGKSVSEIEDERMEAAIRLLRGQRNT